MKRISRNFIRNGPALTCCFFFYMLECTLQPLSFACVASGERPCAYKVEAGARPSETKLSQTENNL